MLPGVKSVRACVDIPLSTASFIPLGDVRVNGAEADGGAVDADCGLEG